FIGCFIDNKINHEFNFYSAHSSGDIISPLLCQQSCHLMGFELASIESRIFCFCQRIKTISLTKTFNENCYQYVCPGDKNFFCGSDSAILIYSTSVFIKQLNAQVSYELNKMYTLNVFTEGQSKYLFTRNNLGVVSSYNKLNTSSLIILQNFFSNALKSFELIASNDENMSDVVDLIVPVSLVNTNNKLEKLSVDCPAYISIEEYLRCDIQIYGKLSNTELLILHNDDTVESLFTPDPVMNFYGTRVPSNLIESQILTTILSQNVFYLISDSQVKIDSLLRSFEIYSYDQFSINLHVFEFVDLLKKTETNGSYNCSSTFNKFKNFCDNTNLNLANILNATYNIKKTYTLSLKKGYNIFYDSDLDNSNFINLKTGWSIAIEALTSGRLVIDNTSKTTDFSLTKFPNSNLVVPLNMKILTGINIEHYQIINNFKSFKTIGNKIVKFQIRNKNSLEILSEVIKNLTVVSPIKNLAIFPFSRSCSVNRSCQYMARVNMGSHIQYTWIFSNFSTIYTEQNLTSFSFPMTGNFTIKLIARNNISIQITEIKYQINEGLRELVLHSGNLDVSTSITNKTARFLFRIKSVQEYMCLLNFGDSINYLNFNESFFDNNNMFINRTYTKSGVYYVSLTCSQNIDQLTFRFIHLVQDEITGLSLIERGIDLSIVFFRIGFRLITGSEASVSVFINSILNNETSFNKTSLIGYSGLLVNNGQTRMINVTIKAFNLVSSMEITSFFEIGSEIIEPELVLPKGVNYDIYEFTSKPINYTIRIKKGSNVKIDFFFGTEKDLTPTLSRIFIGSWMNDYVGSYTHLEPGDYLIRVKITNAFSDFDIYKSISFISRVDNLNCYPKPGFVLLKFSRAYVEFKIKNIGNTHPGSKATLKFWPGDQRNLTFGPFLLGMDKYENKIPFSYTYTQLGSYRPVLFIQNELGGKFFQLDVMVISSSVDDMYVVVRPSRSLLVNQNFQFYKRRSNGGQLALIRLH
ncbi:unnamed protein product, partial [Brachionus calyciflorus]